MTENNNNHTDLWKELTAVKTDVAWIKKGIWAIGIPVGFMFLEFLFNVLKTLPVLAK